MRTVLGAITRRALRLVVSVVALSAVAGSHGAVGEPEGREGDGFTLAVSEGRMTLVADGAPLSEILRALGDRAGIEVTLRGDLSAPVRAVIEDAPIGRALTRLLRRSSNAVVFEPDRGGGERRVARLWVLGAGGGPAGEPDGLVISDDAAVVPADPDELAARRSAANQLLRLATGTGEPQLKLTGPRALLRALAGDPDPFARSRAAAALGALGRPAASPALERALRDDHPAVRAQAIQALGRIGGDRAVDAIGRLGLEAEERSDRLKAAAALAARPGAAAARYLEQIARDEDRLVAEVARAALKTERRPGLSSGKVSK